MNDLFRAAGEAWGAWALHVTWQATLLAAVILLVVRVGRRWPAPLRQALLIVALLKFVLPPMLAAPTGVFSAFGAVLPAEPPAAFDLALPPESAPVFASTPDAGSILFAVLPAEAETGIGWLSVLMMVHLAGIAAGAVIVARQARRWRGIVERADELVDGDAYERMCELACVVGLRRVPRLLVTDEIEAPTACGLLRPAVLLPRGMAEALPPAELDVVLAHELAHHRRGDLWVHAAALAVAALWWFNPLAWRLGGALREVREDGCDDAVLAAGVASGEGYCAALLRAARAQAAPLGLAASFADRAHPIGRRMRRLMDDTLPRRATPTLTDGLLAALLAVSVLPGMRRAATGEPAPPAAFDGVHVAVDVDTVMMVPTRAVEGVDVYVETVPTRAVAPVAPAPMREADFQRLRARRAMDAAAALAPPRPLRPGEEMIVVAPSRPRAATATVVRTTVPTVAPVAVPAAAREAVLPARAPVVRPAAATLDQRIDRRIQAELARNPRAGAERMDAIAHDEVRKYIRERYGDGARVVAGPALARDRPLREYFRERYGNGARVVKPGPAPARDRPLRRFVRSLAGFLGGGSPSPSPSSSASPSPTPSP